MTFKSFNFKYTPPQTLSTPAGTTPAESVIPGIVSAANSVTSSASSGSSSTGSSISSVAASSSAAGKIISQIDNLLETNLYLQKIIIIRTAGIGVTLDPAVDPETARAFSTLYPSLPTPSVVTVNMYNRTLDAEGAASQINSALGNNTKFEVNAHETGAAIQINKFTEDNLAVSGQFISALPLLLRNLKTDVVVLNNIKTAVSTYPVVSIPPDTSLKPLNPNVISLSGQDVSPELQPVISNHLDNTQASYASIYNLTATTGVVNQNINPVTSLCINEPTPNLIRMGGLFNNMIGSVHSPALMNYKGDLTATVFTQLIAEAVVVLVESDRFNQAAVMPMQNTTSGVGNSLSVLNSAQTQTSVKSQGVQGTFSQTSGPLKGMSNAYQNGLPTTPTSPNPPSGISALNPGVAALAAHTNFAMSSSTSSNQLLKESFQKLLQRKTMITNNTSEVLSSLQTTNTITNVTQSVINYNKSGNANSVGSTSTIPPVQAVGQILSGMKNSTGINYVTTGNSIQAVPPTLPTPSPTVQATLIAGGVKLTVPSVPKHLFQAQ